jgi:putative colanic acid biosynthesis UDP-glucose lipid carrier transferase
MKARNTEISILYLTSDLVILNLVILLTAWLRTSHTLTNYQYTTIYFIQGNLSWIIAYVFFSKRNLYLQDGFLNRCKRITQRMMTFTFISVVFFFFVIPEKIHKSFFLEYLLLFYFVKINYYWFFSLHLDNRRRKGFHISRALIIGINNTTHHLRKLIDSNPILGFQFIGFLSSKTKKDEDIIGSPNELNKLIETHQIQMLFISQTHFLEVQNAKRYLEICNKKGIRIRVIPENQNRIKNEGKLETIGKLKVINPQEIPLDDILARLIKRIFDLIFSIFFIVFVSTWLFPIIALLIKSNSKGPVFFIQERTGINNKIFKCYKFRTMCVNEMANQLQATLTDKRITDLGKFMRKTNLDEFPQFFNILMGQMSVTGPRPHMIKHTNIYSELIGHYMIRQYVKPGLTGWAQVNGLRGETNELWKMEKRVEFDMNYIENWSFLWDLKIIIKTITDRKTYLNAG